MNHLPAKVEAKIRKEADTAAQSETCPQQGPSLYFASLFQPLFLFWGDSFSFVNRNPLHIHNREGWSCCGLRLSLRLSLHLLSIVLVPVFGFSMASRLEQAHYYSLSGYLRAIHTPEKWVECWGDASWPEDMGAGRGTASTSLGDSRARCHYK